MKLRAGIAAPLAGLVLASSVAVPASASDRSGDAYIKHSRYSAIPNLRICLSLDNRRGDPAHCAPRKDRWLKRGYSSAIYAIDADGVYLTADYEMTVNGGRVIAGRSGNGNKGKLFKIAGCLNLGPTTCTKTIRVYRKGTA
jgi:hypothetical protein